MAFDYKTIRLEQILTSVWQLTVSRPEVLNAINKQVLDEMADGVRQISEMDFSDAKVLIVTGAGEKAFVAGADIQELSQLDENQALEFSRRGQSIFNELALLKIPVIAAVNGFALGGGCELALACDFIYASEKAKFGLPEVNLGVIPGYGGTVRMPRAIGQRMAREWIYSGSIIDATTAAQMGLVNKVVSSEQLFPEVLKITDLIKSKGPIAISKAKMAINRTWNLDVEDGLRLEAQLFSEVFQFSEVSEGTQAFLEKRKPQF